jgi:hypothetical protein
MQGDRLVSPQNCELPPSIDTNGAPRAALTDSSARVAIALRRRGRCRPLNEAHPSALTAD